MTDRHQPWVLLHHQVENLPGLEGGLGRGDHFDLMLSPQDSKLLWTWAIPINPLDQPLPLKCEVDRLPDHRRVYLDYEGPISGDRGKVNQVAKGTCEVMAWSEQEVEVRLRLDEVRLRLSGTSQEDSFLISLTRQQQGWHLSWSNVK